MASLKKKSDVGAIQPTSLLSYDVVASLCEKVDGSLSLLHDDSPKALYFIHNLLVHFLHRHNIPRQVASLLILNNTNVAGGEGEGEGEGSGGDGDGDIRSSRYGLNHNTHSGVVLMVYDNSSLVTSLLPRLPQPFNRGPLLLISLHHHLNNREALKMVKWARLSGLIQPLLSNGTDQSNERKSDERENETRRGFTLTTYFPFNPHPHTFHFKIFTAGEVLTLDHLEKNRFPDFHGYVMDLASWVDDFPVMF
ncbi:hypothetical protein Pmani_016496, partial [Petrolisthes manimaculis]